MGHAGSRRGACARAASVCAPEGVLESPRAWGRGALGVVNSLMPRLCCTTCCLRSAEEYGGVLRCRLCWLHIVSCRGRVADPDGSWREVDLYLPQSIANGGRERKMDVVVEWWCSTSSLVRCGLALCDLTSSA